MCPALEFRVFVAGLALQSLIFMDRFAAKDGSISFVILLLASFYCMFIPSPSLGREQRRTTLIDLDPVSNLNIDSNKEILIIRVRLLLK